MINGHSSSPESIFIPNYLVKKLFYIIILITTTAYGQSWPALKLQLKSSSEKNKQQVSELIKKQKLASSFSDHQNHFLLHAVHPSGKPIYLVTLNAGAATTSGASLLQNRITGFNLTGNGQHIFQWDAGLVKTHIELGNRVIANEGTVIDNHATHVAGILIASGINPLAKGMSPSANLHANYFDDDLQEMAAIAEVNPYGFLISNHSYGTNTGWHRVNNNWEWFGDALVSSDEDYTAGYYSLRSKQIDEMALLAPYYTIVWAAGNDRGDGGNGTHPPDCNGGTGYDCIIQEGAAKNIITVGAVNKVLNYTGSSSVVMSNFSSWGPTDDGRIKPDLVGAGVGLISSTGNGTNGYASFSGTSMATPNVAGSLMLLQELHGKLNGGKWMKATALKALAVHTAKEAGTSPGPDYSFGWGLIDVAEAARLISIRDDENVFVLDGELKNGETHQWTLQPQLNKKITATLVWNDPAGLPPGDVLDAPYSMLVNDLDIRLVDGNNLENFPWILNPGSPASIASRGDNVRDNVEKLEFDFPEAKPYQLKIKHKGFLVGGSQPYSLIISYTSQNTSHTLYWVGGGGNWNDAAHWSFTSGGLSAGILPGANDKVVVDENSFLSTGNIILDGGASCKSFRWWNTKLSGIDFANHSLEIKKELTLASEAFQKSGNGNFILNSLDSGVVNGNVFLNQKPNIQFSGGQWKIQGIFAVDSLKIISGEVDLVDANLSVNFFQANSANTKFKAIKSSILLVNSWISDETKVDIISEESTIAINTDASLNTKNLNWNGTLSLTSSTTSVTGNITIDSLHMEGGANISLANNSILSVDKAMDLVGTNNNPGSISSTGIASLQLNHHKKYCIDFLNVNKVNLTGESIANLESNSTLINATGWLNQNCQQILFPDFTTKYNCVGGRTEFTNTSTGTIETHHWNFGDVGSPDNESTQENSTHRFNTKEIIG